MQLKFIYPTSISGIPFFYIIQHIPTGKYYAGSKWGKQNRISDKTDSSIFMTESGYQTSSKIIQELIHKEGLAAFKVRKIRHFNSSEEAHNYEVKFLKRIKAKNNPRWYNQSYGGLYVKFHSEETKLKMSIAKRAMSAETKAKMAEVARNRKFSTATRLKWSNFRKTYKVPDSVKRKMAKSAKKAWAKRKAFTI